MGFSSVVAGGVTAPRPDYLWDFTALTGLADGDPITSVLSTGVSAGTATASGSARPLFRGVNGAQFDGSDDLMTAPIAAISGRTLPFYFGFFARGPLTTINQDSGPIGISETASFGYMAMAMSLDRAFWAYGTGSSDYVRDLSFQEQLAWNALIGCRADSSSYVFSNGSVLGSDSTPLPPLGQASVLNLGAGYGGSAFWAGFIRRVAIWLPSESFTFPQVRAMSDFLRNGL